MSYTTVFRDLSQVKTETKLLYSCSLVRILDPQLLNSTHLNIKFILQINMNIPTTLSLLLLTAEHKTFHANNIKMLEIDRILVHVFIRRIYFMLTLHLEKDL